MPTSSIAKINLPCWTVDKMRISVVHALEATVGGTRRHLIDLIRFADLKRFNVSVVCSTLRDRRFLEDIKWMYSNGIQAHIVQMRRRISPVADFISLCKLCAILWQIRPHIVHAHSSKAGAIARLAARIVGVPIIIYTPHAFSFLMSGGLTSRAFIKIERAFGGLTDALIAVSESEMKVALSERIVPPQKVFLIENGIDFELVRYSEAERLRWRSRWGIPPSAPVIGCVGDFRTQKGQRYLIEAMPKVLSKVSDAYLVLVGRGELEHKLKALPERFGILGRVVFEREAHDDFSIYSAFDVYVLPSLYEGLPYTPLEALACGLPVVLSDVVGNKDVFMACASVCGDASVLGELVEPRSSDMLADALIRVLQNVELQSEHMRSKRREAVKVRFPVCRMVDRTQRLYEELFAKKVVHRH